MRNKLKKIVGTLLTFALAFTIIGGEAKAVNAATAANVRWTGGEAVKKVGESEYAGYIVLNKGMIDNLIDEGADFGTMYSVSDTGPTGNGMTPAYADMVIAATGLNSAEIYLLPMEQQGGSNLARSRDAGTIVNEAILGVLLAVEKTPAPFWYFNYYKADGKAIKFGMEANGTLPLELQEPSAEIKDLPVVRLISISGEKTWVGNGVKPDSITVNLLQDTEVYRSQVVKAVEGIWAYEFKDVPVTDEAGKEHEYEIEEIEVPGFTTNYDGFDIINTTIDTPVIKGTIEFLKYDGERKALEGATFKLYSAEDTAFETEMATATSDVNGLVRFSDVTEGDYKIKESAAPIGYLMSDLVLEATITVNGARVTPLGGPVVNERIMGTVKVKKVDKEDHEKVLAGAKFSIVDNKTEVEVYTGTTDENGMIEKELPFGEYTLSEVSAPEGYETSEETEEFNIVENDEVVEILFENEMVEIIDVEPLPIKVGTLKITKVDEENHEKVLEGAKFKVVDAESKTVFEGTTDENGILEIKLLLGEYTISEVEPPKDYEKTNKTWTADLIEKDKTVALVITNKMIEVEVVDPLPVEDEVGTLKIKKVDKETGAALAGVKFRITDKDGDVVFEGLTDVNGMIEEELLVGDYTVTELEALPGYVASAKTETAKIEKDGDVVELTITNRKIYGLLSIKKVDMETGEVLEGARFSIVDKDGKVILEDVTDEEGMLEVWLPKGEYIISETEAPEDYVGTEETWSVKVTADGQVFNLVVENEMIEIEEVSPETLPQTGGIPSAALYILGAFAIFTGLQLTRKRKTV